MYIDIFLIKAHLLEYAKKNLVNKSLWEKFKIV